MLSFLNRPPGPDYKKYYQACLHVSGTSPSAAWFEEAEMGMEGRRMRSLLRGREKAEAGDVDGQKAEGEQDLLGKEGSMSRRMKVKKARGIRIQRWRGMRKSQRIRKTAARSKSRKRKEVDDKDRTESKGRAKAAKSKKRETQSAAVSAETNAVMTAENGEDEGDEEEEEIAITDDTETGAEKAEEEIASTKKDKPASKSSSKKNQNLGANNAKTPEEDTTAAKRKKKNSNQEKDKETDMNEGGSKSNDFRDAEDEESHEAKLHHEEGKTTATLPAGDVRKADKIPKKDKTPRAAKSKAAPTKNDGPEQKHEDRVAQTEKKRSTRVEENQHDAKPEGVSKRAKKATEDQNRKDMAGRKETKGVMINAESGGSLEDEEKPKPSGSRRTTKPAAKETCKDKKGKPAGETAEKKTKKKNKMAEEEEEEAGDKAEDGAKDPAKGKGKVSKKEEGKAKGERAPKPKQPAASFARRPCPSNNEWSKQRWHSLREAFELKVKPHLKHYSKHEVRC